MDTTELLIRAAAFTATYTLCCWSTECCAPCGEPSGRSTAQPSHGLPAEPQQWPSAKPPASRQLSNKGESS